MFSAISGVIISMAMAIVLPLLLDMDFFPSIVFLTFVFTGGGRGSAPVILMNIPGSPSSYATTFDGYPARSGRWLRSSIRWGQSTVQVSRPVNGHRC
jgi:TctA family transporter